jgi:hypothetical protein
VRSVQPAIVLDDHGTPITFRVCQNGPLETRIIRRNARSVRALFRAAAVRIFRHGSRAERAVADAAPAHIGPLQPPPINSVSDRVTQCLHSFPLNAGLGNNPTNRDFYVRSCVNN